ncbi:MAG: hypothetical protein WD875_12530 [Pirellulales bacterium]
MEARLVRAAILAGAILSLGAGYRTQNFVVEAPTPQLAEEFGRAAEGFRKDLAIEWLGRELPPWGEPCPINATVGPNLGAGGATTFMFDADAAGQPQVFGWRMTVQGSRERILDSVLPHEVTHTIFATYFRRPLPRWADEGGSTTVEHVSERAKQHSMLITFLKTSRGIPFDRMFAMKDYPRDIMPLYAQGYATARFLIAQGGKQEFVKFMQSGFEREDWAGAVAKHYGYKNLAELQNAWLGWVREGGPNTVPAKFAGGRPAGNVVLASVTQESVSQEAATQEPVVKGDATPAQPAANQIAAQGGSPSVASPAGWYARAARGEVAAASTSIAHEATHPQAIEPARQIILEWSRAAGSPAPMQSGARPAVRLADADSGAATRSSNGLRQ